MATSLGCPVTLVSLTAEMEDLTAEEKVESSAEEEAESSADEEVGKEGRSFPIATLRMRKLPGCCVLCAGDDNILIR